LPDSRGEDAVKEIVPDKQPIGKTENPSPFTTHALDLVSGTIFYLLTDGYADQFGGPKGKKFRPKQLAQLLSSVCSFPLARQQQELSRAFMEWKGSADQVDDVTILGVKIIA
jgi:serine phosphatase RsbU (regulator of sigma subunit)